ncbi:hypothetical protein ACJJIK_01280 [Microbulbifer sp. ZKSA006]|uniref:hypothetical protein n=1 Tax=Microbulbifer sp. ZKSA006 TaxID=3243390 RepID=UPI00403951F4
MLCKNQEKTQTAELEKGGFSLLEGETPLAFAPTITLNQKDECIPQHYLKYQHTLQSVEAILLDVSYDERYPVFAVETDRQLYIQVGIIGYDNYRSIESQPSKKIVYGRKWRVEPHLPSSEIIQTAYLALQKAREHEVRELFKLHKKEKVTTPFSTHHDLPLMAKYQGMFVNIREPASESVVIQSLEDLRYDGASLKLVEITPVNGGPWLLQLEMTPGPHSQLPEVEQNTFNLLVDDLSENTLFYSLMDTFLSWSNRHLEEFFYFQNYPRFSRKNSIRAISELSQKTRCRKALQRVNGFNAQFEQSNYEIDKTRVPTLSDSNLGRKLAAQIKRHDITEGILPIDCEQFF